MHLGKKINGLCVANNILQKVRDYPLIVAHVLSILSYLYEENDILKRMREGPCNKGRMLKKFPTKFKYSIAIYTLNVYKTSTKKTFINS